MLGLQFLQEKKKKLANRDSESTRDFIEINSWRCEIKIINRKGRNLRKIGETIERLKNASARMDAAAREARRKIIEEINPPVISCIRFHDSENQGL